MKLPKHLRDKIGMVFVGSHLRPKLLPGVVGGVGFCLRGDPPTTTHHAKKIILVRGQTRLGDTPALVAARAWYESRIPEVTALTPVAGPLRADVTFYFPLPKQPDKRRGQVAGAPHQQKPDRDNAVKLLMDVLALRGWIERDEQVTDGMIRKRWAAEGQARVEVAFWTLTYPVALVGAVQREQARGRRRTK